MTRKIRIDFILLSFFLLSLSMFPSVFAQTTYNWNVDEEDEIIFEIEGMEGEDTVLLGEVSLTIETIINDQISYSLTPSFSVDTEKYGQFMQASGSFISNNGYITNTNTELYSVDLVYSQEKFALKEDEWAFYVAGYFDRYWAEYGSNDTISWECTSSAHGYRVWFDDRSISEIWYIQALYDSDGLLENFASGEISDGIEDYVKIARKGNSLFGYYIPGFPLLLLGLVGVFSVGFIVQHVNQRRK